MESQLLSIREFGHRDIDSFTRYWTDAQPDFLLMMGVDNKLFCEPNTLNAAPNRTLEKVGFRFIKTYRTIPGWVGFEQEVNLWELERGL